MVDHASTEGLTGLDEGLRVPQIAAFPLVKCRAGDDPNEVLARPELQGFDQIPMADGSRIAFVSLALLPIQLQVLAQEQEKPQIHYRLIDMGTFGGPASYVNIPDAYAQVLNNRGMVAGSADTPAPDPYPSFCFNEDCFVSHAFESHSGILRDLGVLPGGASSGANWISRNGLIIGESQNGTIDPLIPGFPELHAVFWNHGNIVDLRTLEGGNESIANSVNTRGQIVGWSLNGIPDAFSITGLGYQTRAFVWQKGVMQDLGTLGGPDAMANLVNESGQIVGESYTNSTPSSYCAENLGLSLTTGAFLWQNGKMFNLGGFGGTCTALPKNCLLPKNPSSCPKTPLSWFRVEKNIIESDDRRRLTAD